VQLPLLCGTAFFTRRRVRRSGPGSRRHGLVL